MTTEKKHALDLTMEELIAVIVGKYGGEILITIQDAMIYGSGAMAIKVEDDIIHLKALTFAEAKLMAANSRGNG